MCRVEICFSVFYENMLCRGLCSSCREFQIDWKLDLVLFQGLVQQLNTQFSSAGSCCLNFYFLHKNFFLFSLLFLNMLPHGHFLLPPKAGRKMLSVHSSYVMLGINDFLQCPQEQMRTTGPLWQQGEQSAAHLPRPSLKDACGQLSCHPVVSGQSMAV